MLVNYTVRPTDNMGYHCKLTIIYASNHPSSCSMKSTTKFIHIWWAVGFKNSGGSEMFSGPSLHQKITFQQDTSRTSNISYLTWTWAPPKKTHMVSPPKSTNKQPSFLHTNPPNNGSPHDSQTTPSQLPTNGIEGRCLLRCRRNSRPKSRVSQKPGPDKNRETKFDGFKTQLCSWRGLVANRELGSYIIYIYMYAACGYL